MERQMKGKYNPNYRNGNRLSKNNPCPQCGKDRICENRHADKVCASCSTFNNNWKGGKRSYFLAKARELMENTLGRKLTSDEIVHHLDHNQRNNVIENLHLFPNRSEHILYHRKLQRFIKKELGDYNTKWKN